MVLRQLFAYVNLITSITEYGRMNSTMAVEEEVLHVQIVLQHPTVVEMVAVDLVVGVAMDLILLTGHSCQPLVILFLIEGAIHVVIHLTLLMFAPIVDSDVS
jgi:hypothetical protein